MQFLLAACSAIASCGGGTEPSSADVADVWQKQSWTYVSRVDGRVSTFSSYPCIAFLDCTKFWLSIADGHYMLGAVVPAHDTYGGRVDETPQQLDYGRVTINGGQVTLQTDKTAAPASVSWFPYLEPSLDGFTGDLQSQVLTLRGEAPLEGSVADVTITWTQCSDARLVGARGQPGGWCR